MGAWSRPESPCHCTATTTEDFFIVAEVLTADDISTPSRPGLSEAVSRRGRSDSSHAALHSLSPPWFWSALQGHRRIQPANAKELVTTAVSGLEGSIAGGRPEYRGLMSPSTDSRPPFSSVNRLAWRGVRRVRCGAGGLGGLLLTI